MARSYRAGRHGLPDPRPPEFLAMEVHPIADQRRLPGFERAGRHLAGGDIDHGALLSRPRVDVRRPVIADVHVDHDAVEVRDRGTAARVRAMCDAVRNDG